MKLNQKIKKQIVKFKKFISTIKVKASDIKDFLVGSIAFGALINYALWAIWHLEFTWYRFPAYGVIYYFIAQEFPLWFSKLKAKSRR